MFWMIIDEFLSFNEFKFVKRLMNWFNMSAVVQTCWTFLGFWFACLRDIHENELLFGFLSNEGLSLQKMWKGLRADMGMMRPAGAADLFRMPNVQCARPYMLRRVRPNSIRPSARVEYVTMNPNDTKWQHIWCGHYGAIGVHLAPSYGRPRGARGHDPAW